MSGVKNSRIIRKHILPNTMAPLIVQASLAMSYAILAEAALSFLGLGTQPPTPSWGIMLSKGRDLINHSPWISIWPGLAIMLVVFGFNVLGDGLRDALDPRLKK
jgi:peptide/nickel transport system permease protein